MFWVISLYFNIRNTLPKSGTFLLGHPVYIEREKEKQTDNKILLPCSQWQQQNFLLVLEISFCITLAILSLVQGKFHTVFKGANIRVINKFQAYSQATNFSHHVKPVFCELRERLRQEDNLPCRSGVAGRARRHKLLIHPLLRDKNICPSARFRTLLELNFLQHKEGS